MLKSFSVKRLRVRLRSFLNGSLSKLRNVKDKSVKHPFIIALLLSVLVHAIALAVPIFSSPESDSTLDGEDTEQVESEEDLEDDSVKEGDEPLDVDELPPGPEDGDDTLDSEDDSDDDTSDSEDDLDDSGDDTSDSTDDSDDDISDSTDDSDDDISDSTDDSDDDTASSTDDFSDDTSDSGDDSSNASDDVVDTPTPSESETEVEASNNIPEPPEEDPGDTSAPTPDTENDTEDTAEPDRTPDEDNPEKPVEVAQSNALAQIANYKNAQPLLCGLKIAQKDKNSLFTPDPLDRVSSYFAENLDKNAYQAKLVLDSPNTKVYQISKDGQDGYLHLFAQNSEGTIILFSQERIDCDRLNIQSLKPEDSQEVEKSEEPEKTEEVEKSEESENTQESDKSEELEKKPEQTQEEKVFEDTFANLYEELGWTKDVITAQENKNQPPTPEVETIFAADVDKTPDELVSVVKSKLEEEGFETSQIEDYTDGVLYEVKKGEFTKYITFTPNVDETKVRIVTWKTIPVDSQKG